MAVCQKLGLRLGKNPDIGLIVAIEKKIGNICLKSAIFKLETRNFESDFLIGLSCHETSFIVVCQKLGLRLGKNPDIGSIVGPANKIGNIWLESAIFKLETEHFYTDFLIGLSCQVASFMAVRQKFHLVRRNHTFEARIA